MRGSTGHFNLWLSHKDITLQTLCAGYVAARIYQPADNPLTIRLRHECPFFFFNNTTCQVMETSVKTKNCDSVL